MAAQRLPSRAWARTMVTSSSGVKGRRSGEDERGGPGMRTMRGMHWPAKEEARVHVGPVTACTRDEARLGRSPGGGGAAGSDRSGGED